MVVYNFKKIQVVPNGKDMIDIVLSGTQRRSATVIHKNQKIGTIRKFYTHKVKFTAQTFHDKLAQILDDFPLIDEIHPFYSEMMNVLYDRDHYKVALGQLKMARALIDKIAADYVKLIKYAESQYRCKQLKRAALGRMCTLIKGQHASLGYLEEVRQHMARWSSIDPSTRTLLITGYPNVGKSSFLNKITRADVDVQNYAFTTQSLFVGHTDYRDLRWQVVDTPGILDRPLEERNTIEMQAVTALAHLKASILYFCDISETCGWTIQEQIALFNSIKPLFVGKPLFFICTKTDLRTLEDLPEEDSEAIQTLMEENENMELLTLSNMNEEGIAEVKVKACDKLLAQRVEREMASKAMADIMNRIYVAEPKKRDKKKREVFIPDTVKQLKENPELASAMRPEKTQKELQEEGGGAGVYQPDYRAEWLLANPDERYDIIPEIMNGKNIADFMDEDIEAKLLALEEEEEARVEEKEARDAEWAEYEAQEEMDETELAMAKAVRRKTDMAIHLHRQTERRNHARMPRTTVNPVQGGKFADHLASMGIRRGGVEQAADSATRRSRDRSRVREALQEKADAEGGINVLAGQKRARDQSAPRDSAAYKNAKQRVDAVKASRLAVKDRNRAGARGEADRHQNVAKEKWLLAGKRGMGTTRSR